HWVLSLAGAGCVLLLVLAMSIPNLLRSKMAANESAEIGRRRAAEAERIVQELNGHDIAGPSPRPGLSIPADHRSRGGGEALPLEEQGRNSMARARKDETKTLHQSWIQEGPMIARMVSLAIVVKDFDASRVSLDAILSRHKGYAANLNVSTPQG